MATHSMGGLI